MGGLVDMIIENLINYDEKYRKIFKPTRITAEKFLKGRRVPRQEEPNETRALFARNLMAAFYCSNPDLHFRFMETKIGEKVITGGKVEAFFRDIINLTKVQSLRDKTVRHVAKSVQAVESMIDTLYALHYQYDDSIEGEMISDEDPVSANDRIRAAAGQQAQEAEKEVDAIDAIDALASMNGGREAGLHQGHGSTNLPSKEVMNLLEKVKDSPFLLTLIDSLGRSLTPDREATKEKVPSKRRSVPTHECELGNDLPSVYPSEFGLKRKQRLLFLAKLAEGDLLQDKMVPPIPKEMGDIIILSDHSSSMDGHPRLWTATIATLINLRCQGQGRNVHYYPFDTRLMDKVRDVSSLLDHYRLGGGTDIQRCFEQLLDEIEKDETVRLAECDILVLTDGESAADRAGVQEKWDAFAARHKGVRRLGIKIRSGYGGYDDGVGALSQVTDMVVSLSKNPAEDLKGNHQIFNWIKERTD